LNYQFKSGNIKIGRFQQFIVTKNLNKLYFELFKTFDNAYFCSLIFTKQQKFTTQRQQLQNEQQQNN